jgi:hypothetical protein
LLRLKRERAQKRRNGYGILKIWRKNSIVAALPIFKTLLLLSFQRTKQFYRSIDKLINAKSRTISAMEDGQVRPKLAMSLTRILQSPSVLLFVSAVIIYTLCLNSFWSSDHPTSFLELAWAIWHNHSFALAKVNLSISCPGGGSNPIQYGNNVYCTVDDFSYKGYYYSALAPGTAFLMLPFAAIGFAIDKTLNLYGAGLIYSEFFVALTNGLAAVLVYKISRLYFKVTTSVFIAFAYAFSTISWPFATFIFQSDPSAAFDLLAAFLALKMTHDAKKISVKLGVFCGLALSLAILVDYVNAILIPIILLYLLFSFRGRETKQVMVKQLVGFILATFVSIGAIGAYNYLSFGNPFLTSEGLYLGGGVFASFSQPLDLGLLLNLFTPFRGLFFYSPILVLGLIGFYKMLEKDAHTKDGFFLLTLFLGILFPYSKWYTLDAGLSYGPRFIIPCIPFLLIPLGFVLEDKRWQQRQGKPRKIMIIAYVLYAIGAVTNGIAALTSALAGTETSWLRSPFLYSALPAFLSGSFDSWLLDGYSHEFWWLFGFVFIGTVLVLPAIFYRYFVSCDRASQVKTSSNSES